MGWVPSRREFFELYPEVDGLYFFRSCWFYQNRTKLIICWWQLQLVWHLPILCQTLKAPKPEIVWFPLHCQFGLSNSCLVRVRCLLCIAGCYHRPWLLPKNTNSSPCSPSDCPQISPNVSGWGAKSLLFGKCCSEHKVWTLQRLDCFPRSQRLP